MAIAYGLTIESNMRRTRPILLVPLLVGLLPSMAPVPASAADSPYVAPKVKALLVFVNDRFIDRKVKYTVFTAERDCLAVFGGEESELVEMKPGKHTLYAMGANVNRMEVDLAPNRTYFVRINSKTRYSKGVAVITPAQRGTETFDQVNLWIAETKVTKGKDTCRGTKIEDDKRGRIPTRIGRADEEWKAGDDAFRAKHSLQKKDGFTAKEVAKVTAAPAPAK